MEGAFSGGMARGTSEKAGSKNIQSFIFLRTYGIIVVTAGSGSLREETNYGAQYRVPESRAFEAKSCFREKGRLRQE